MEQTKIRESWEAVLKVHFHLIEKGIDSEGWYSNERNDQWLPLEANDMNLYDFRNDNTEVRPKILNELVPIIANTWDETWNQIKKESIIEPDPMVSEVRDLLLKLEWQVESLEQSHQAAQKHIISLEKDRLDTGHEIIELQVTVSQLEAKNKELREALKKIKIACEYMGLHNTRPHDVAEKALKEETT